MKIRQIFLWYLLLNKRLLKKYTFILILCMVPLLALGMRQTARQESGMLKIALCEEEASDELSARVIQNLIEDKGVLQFLTCETKEEAYEAVKNKSVDAAWIFPGNMGEKVDEFAAQHSLENSVITIVEREDNVALQLAREKLYGVLYPYISYAIYDNYIRMNLIQGKHVTDEELRADYEETRVEGSLFQRTYVNSEEAGENEEEENYLLLPLRGLLSLWLILCGMAASLYFIQDKEAGVFSWVPIRKEIWLTYGYYFVVIGDAALVMLLALKLSGIFTTFWNEAPLLLLLTLASILFCNLIRMLCGKMQRLAVCIPPVILVMLVLCPVFLNVRVLRPVKYLLPPFYYLNALHNVTFVWEMIIYIFVLFGIEYFLYRLIIRGSLGK